MTWELLGGVLVGALIGEYYRRVNDRIRREQIKDLREDKPVGRAGRTLFCEETEDDLEWAEVFDELNRPQRRGRKPLMTPEQQAEYLATGATRGKRIREAEAQA